MNLLKDRIKVHPRVLGLHDRFRFARWVYIQHPARYLGGAELGHSPLDKYLAAVSGIYNTRIVLHRNHPVFLFSAERRRYYAIAPMWVLDLLRELGRYYPLGVSARELRPILITQQIPDEDDVSCAAQPHEACVHEIHVDEAFVAKALDDWFIRTITFAGRPLFRGCPEHQVQNAVYEALDGYYVQVHLDPIPDSDEQVGYLLIDSRDCFGKITVELPWLAELDRRTDEFGLNWHHPEFPTMDQILDHFDGLVELPKCRERLEEMKIYREVVEEHDAALKQLLEDTADLF